MTPTDLATSAIKALIENRAGDFPVLANIPIRTLGTDEEHVGLQIVVTHEEPEANPILKTVLTIPMAVQLGSVPGESDAAATPQADHQAVAGALYDILTNPASITFCDAYDGLQCFDILGVVPSTTGEDGMRSTVIGFSMVACKRGT